MYRVRLWSARNARALSVVYDALEWCLVALHPVLNRIGYDRLDRPFAAVEGVFKGLLFDSKSCGQCTLGATGMACPMNCPKSLRNGPCGGVRSNGNCEVEPDMVCVWVSAWEGSAQLDDGVQAIQVVQNPVDQRLKGRSAWLRSVRERVQSHLGGSNVL